MQDTGGAKPQQDGGRKQKIDFRGKYMEVTVQTELLSMEMI